MNHHTQRGSAAVETALLLPIMILMMVAIMEFGLYFLRFYIYEQAVFSGARAGAIAESGKNEAARTETLRVLEEMGISEASVPEISIESDEPGPVAGTTLTTVRINAAYTPIIGYSSLVLPTRIRAVSSALNY